MYGCMHVWPPSVCLRVYAGDEEEEEMMKRTPTQCHFQGDADCGVRAALHLQQESRPVFLDP